MRYFLLAVCFVIFAAGCGRSSSTEKSELEKTKEELEKKLKAEEYNSIRAKAWVEVRTEYGKKEESLEKSYQTKKEALEGDFKKRNDLLNNREAGLNEREKLFVEELKGLSLLVKQADQVKKEIDEKKKEVQKLIDEKVNKLIERKKRELLEITQKSEYVKTLRTKELESLRRELAQATPRAFGGGANLDRQLAYKEQVRAKLERKQREIEDGEQEFQREFRDITDEFDAVIKELNSLSIYPS